MVSQLLPNKNTPEIMHRSRETPDVTTKPTCYDLINILVRQGAHCANSTKKKSIVAQRKRTTMVKCQPMIVLYVDVRVLPRLRIYPMCVRPEMRCLSEGRRPLTVTTQPTYRGSLEREIGSAKPTYINVYIHIYIYIYTYT